MIHVYIIDVEEHLGFSRLSTAKDKIQKCLVKSQKIVPNSNMRPQINFAPLCLTKSSELDHNLSISWDSIFVRLDFCSC